MKFQRLLASAIGFFASISFAGSVGIIPEEMQLHGAYKRPGFEFCTETGLMKDGTHFKSNCIEIGGFVQADVTTYSSNDFFVWQNNGAILNAFTPLFLRNGADIRRARLYVQGILARDWEYRIEYDAASDGEVFFINEQHLKDAYLRFNGFHNTFFTMGQFWVATDMQQTTQPYDLTFMERAQAVQAFTPNRRVAAQANLFTHWAVASAALFGSDYRPVVNGDNIAAGIADQPFGIAGRLFVQPWHEQGRMFGVGVSAWYQNAYDDDALPALNGQFADNYRFRTNPGLAEYRGARLVDTGPFLTNVDHVTVYSGEAAFICGPFDAEGAYFYDSISRILPFVDLGYHGWYVQGSYFITGEHRNWDSRQARFTEKSSNNNEYGALQVALRYDSIVLNDEKLPVVDGLSWFGGNQQNFTIGLNYYPTDMIRFMFNYIFAQYKPTNGLPKMDYSMFGARAQILV